MIRTGMLMLLTLACAGCPTAPPPAVDDPTSLAANPDPAPATEPGDTADPGTPDPSTAPGPSPSTEPASPPQPLTHEAAFAKAKPVFDKYCESCHSKDGVSTSREALDHFDMTSYPFGGHHAAEVAKSVRKSLGIGGKATMPQGDPGAIKGAELEAVLAWADAFEKANAKEGHEQSDHKH